MSALVKPHKLHVVDVLGNVIGRDQPVMRIDKALELVSLLDEETFADDNTVFFDPFCKAGEILFACAYMSCSVKSKRKLMSTEEIYREIFASNRYFAIAPDERHHRLSLRTFLGNKNSHDGKHNHIIRNGNYLSEIDGSLNKNKFNEEFEAMIEYVKKTAGDKRIIVVGNPPYQEADGGAQKSATPVYNFFVEKLIDSGIINEFVLVIPARWFSVGKKLDEFRKKIRLSGQIKTITYFAQSENIFPTVVVAGGICFLNWTNKYQDVTKFQEKGETYKINLARFDIVPDDPNAGEVVAKIKYMHKGKWVSDLAWPRNPFGLATNYFQQNKEINTNSTQVLKCYTKGQRIRNILKQNIKKNANKVSLYKVCTPSAYGAKRTIPKDQVFILERDVVCTETYTIINIFESKGEAQDFLTYLRTDFARYLLGLRKLTQHIPRDRWAWVPLLDNLHDITEEKIFKMFNLTQDEIDHIRKKVREWS